VSTVEALFSAGVVDPYECYQYVHVSEVGSCAGGGMGGMDALQKIFYGRSHEADAASDILQESFINTVPSWMNMLVFSSSKPLRTVVGACATAAESVDVAVDALVCGRAKVMVGGGYDDFCAEGSYEFAQMGATSSSEVEAGAGREPREAVRPMASTRGGFMESQGSGIQVLTTARLALDMGLPIYGLVIASNTATDKVGRSVPAPGQGVLTTAREAFSPGSGSGSGGGEVGSSPILDVAYRRRRLAGDLDALASWRVSEKVRRCVRRAWWPLRQSVRKRGGAGWRGRASCAHAWLPLTERRAWWRAAHAGADAVGSSFPGTPP
jgi:fatty acid synthase subunit alpha